MNEKKKLGTLHSKHIRIPYELIDSGLFWNLSATARKVYTTLKRYENWKGEPCFPSYNLISQKSKVKGASRIKKAIEELSNAGMIEYTYQRRVDNDGKEYGRKVHFYIILYD